jgi:hypothetical protein
VSGVPEFNDVIAEVSLMITVDLAAALALFAARPVAVEVASRPAAIRATERKVRFAFIFLSLLLSSFDAGKQTRFA